ncbi:MAG: 1-acyl-sn-glycerol-3-phosphate acyltransferase [Actinomycetales bacterium]|nr:1-acyl-sn-glycerol-3-phosphate acyltransferase [Actinomycetales bacterium]
MRHPARANRAYRFIANIVRPLMFATTRRAWSGGENFPRDRGFIAAANHMSYADPLTTAHYLYDHGFAPRILAKAPLFKVFFVGPILRSSGQIPVYRNSSRAGESLEAAFTALDGGECVFVFPEGTLTRDPDLWPMTGKTGVARLALQSKAPVIPIAQWGAQDLIPRYGKFPRLFGRKQQTVVAGPPVDLSDLYGKPLEGAVLREATERVMAAITVLLAEIRGEEPPATRFDPRTNPEVSRKIGGDHATKPELP